MKKLPILFVLIFCSLSFNVVQAESTIIYLKPVDSRAANSEKAREKLDKDNETNYQHLKDQLKSLSTNINTNINQSISAQEEYEYQLRVYKLKAELACIDKEGYYSSFNFETKECECDKDSIFVDGKCENESRLRLNNLLMCVKTFGPLTHYNYEEAGCVCDEGNEFDWSNNGLCTMKKKPLVENRYIPVAERQNTPKTKISIPRGVKPSGAPETTNKIVLLAQESSIDQSVHDSRQGNLTLTDQKTTMWQRFKIGLARIKFW